MQPIPIALSDEAMGAVLRAAAPIDVRRRDDFLQAVALALSAILVSSASKVA
jgi:hypothetical protein